MGKLVDITGQRFGRLVVIKRAVNNKRGDATWKCLCACGTEGTDPTFYEGDD